MAKNKRYIYDTALTFQVPKNLSETIGLWGIQKHRTCYISPCAHHSPPSRNKENFSLRTYCCTHLVSLLKLWHSNAHSFFITEKYLELHEIISLITIRSGKLLCHVFLANYRNGGATPLTTNRIYIHTHIYIKDLETQICTYIFS